MTQRLLLSWLLIVAATGCGSALLDKAEPLNVRYFTPTLATPTGGQGAVGAGSLRLGRVEASEHLRERIAFRASEHEVGFYEGFRWTEQPDAYFKRALSRELFESERFEHAVAGVAPTLEAELVAFEELREQDAVRVEARVLVHDGRRVAMETTVRIQEPRGEQGPVAIAAALSRALQKCVAQITTEVENTVSSLSASSPAPADLQ